MHRVRIRTGSRSVKVIDLGDVRIMCSYDDVVASSFKGSFTIYRDWDRTPSNIKTTYNFIFESDGVCTRCAEQHKRIVTLLRENDIRYKEECLLQDFNIHD